MKDILALCVALESVFFLNECSKASSNFDFYMLGSISIVLNIFALILLFTKEENNA